MKQFHTIIFCCFHFKSDANLTPAEMAPPLFSIILALAIVFVVCEFGQRLTDQFEMFDEKLSLCKWYLFPFELQQMFLIVMSNTQQLTCLHGYGNIPCTRDSFKEVLSHIAKGLPKFTTNLNIFCFSLVFQTTHSGFSYFMLLRQMDG